MKLFNHSSIMLLMLGINLYSQISTELDSIPRFRGINWGSSIETVKALELASYQQSYIGFGVYILTYHGQILDQHTKIDYVFEDNILVEAFYTIDVESFPENFQSVKELYFNKLGIPNYWASSHPDTSIDWALKGDEQFCRGPEIYWEFCNGFIGLISEKFKDDISISILYCHGKTIAEYGKFVIYPYENIVGTSNP